MSINIRMAFADDGENCWQNRKELLVERIRAFNPDLLGLQECVDTIQSPYIQSALPDYRFLGRRRGGPGGDPALEVSAILYKPQVFEEIEHRTFWLSETPDIPESLSWGAEFCRTVEQVTLQPYSPPSGKPRPFTLFNTHFDYAGQAPLESARVLRNRIEAFGPEMPVLVSGDFNIQKDSQPYLLLLHGAGNQDGLSLRDTYRQVFPWGQESEDSYHGFGRTSTGGAIDWILASEHFEVIEAGIDRFQRGNLHPSDHYPVWAVVRWSLP